MGEVREAWDVVLCRTVALKVLKKMDPGSLIRFMHEARLQSRVVHPNICQIFDVDSSESAPRIAMQLVRGPTLTEACGGLAVEEIVRILAQVAEAAHAAHELNLIHRDLKPSNILLDPVPEGGWKPYVVDFGLAMELGGPILTAPLWVNGTPAYMAPEQVRGERSLIGPPTDVFALGGTLHFALHGRPPRGADAGSGPWPAPEQRRAVSRDLDWIVRKCTHSNPGLRYPTAAALAGDLWCFLRGEPVEARPAGLLESHWRHWRWLWKPALAATLAVAALGSALALEQRQVAAAGRRRGEWDRFFVLEAAAMDRNLSMERMLAPHDMRPTYLRLRTRLLKLGARLRTLGPDAQGSGHYALGQGRFLLGDWPGAQQELALASTSGFQGPEVAGLLARTLAAAQEKTQLEAQFTTGATLSAAVLDPAAARVASLFRQGQRPGTGADDYGEAQVAFLRKDFAKAAERARDAGGDQPWSSGPAVLATFSLTALGQQGLEAGDALLAEARFEEAMDLARGRLGQNPSDEALHHAYLLAALSLAALRLDRQQLSGPFLESLQMFAERAVGLNPANPDLEDDRLQLGILKARRMEQLDLDPEAELDSALQFMTSWARPPLSAPLRADRMLIHWLQAAWAFRQGGDPEPALAEALRDPGHTPFLDRDYLGEILNFKAQVEAAQGHDPRPTLDLAMACMDPLLDTGAPRSLFDTAAQSWLIRSRWEAAHGLDPHPSRQRSQTLLERGRCRHPRPLAIERLAVRTAP
jgi:serine/threonine-protein kinase